MLPVASIRRGRCSQVKACIKVSHSSVQRSGLVQVTSTAAGCPRHHVTSATGASDCGRALVIGGSAILGSFGATCGGASRSPLPQAVAQPLTPRARFGGAQLSCAGPSDTPRIASPSVGTVMSRACCIRAASALGRGAAAANGAASALLLGLANGVPLDMGDASQPEYELGSTAACACTRRHSRPGRCGRLIPRSSRWESTRAPGCVLVDTSLRVTARARCGAAHASSTIGGAALAAGRRSEMLPRRVGARGAALALLRPAFAGLRMRGDAVPRTPVLCTAHAECSARPLSASVRAEWQPVYDANDQEL